MNVDTLERRRAKIPQRGEREVRICREAWALRETDGGGGLVVAGYAVVSDAPQPLGDFATERFKPGAFRRTLGNSIEFVVRIGIDGLPVARTPHTVQLEENDHGLRVVATLNPDDVAPLRGRGSVYAVLWFRAIEQAWTADYSTREIQQAELQHCGCALLS